MLLWLMLMPFLLCQLLLTLAVTAFGTVATAAVASFTVFPIVVVVIVSASVKQPQLCYHAKSEETTPR